MKRKDKSDKIRNLLSPILVILNGLVLFLATIARSTFDGYNNYGYRCSVDFRISIFGSWLEHCIFYNSHEGTSTGVASDIGNYSSAIIPLVSVALVLSFFGMIFVWSRFDWQGKDKTLEEQAKIERKYRTIGSGVSILGGVLGLVALILFAVFISTVEQPFTGFPSSNTPKVLPSFWYYFSFLCFLIYFSSGIYTLVNFYRKPKQHKEESSVG